MYKKFQKTLSNGLKLLWDNRPSYQSVTITCIVQAGSCDDYKAKNGLAHCVEHLVFQSPQRSDQIPIFHDILDSGGMINACTTLDTTTFFASTFKDDALSALQTLVQLITHIPDNQKSLDREKIIINEEMSILGHDNKYSFQRVKFRLMGASEQTKHAAIGTPKTLKKISFDDIQTFHNQYYVADNIIISIVGNLDVEKHLEHIESVLLNIKSGQHNNQNLLWKPVKGPRHYFVNSRSDAYVNVFFTCPIQNETDLCTLEMLSEIFVLMPFSRLYQELRRNRSLVYSMEGEFFEFQNFATLDVYTVSRPRNVVKLLRYVLEEGHKMASKQLTFDDFEKLKEQYIKRLMLHFEAPPFASGWYAYRERLAQTNDISSWTEKIQEVELNSIRIMAGRIFQPENTFAYIIAPSNLWRRFRIRGYLRKQPKTKNR
jgi:predicted Zn-dependent peptidase